MLHPFRMFLVAAAARTYPRVAWLFRSRSWIVQESILPILSVSAFAYSYRAMGAPPEFTGVLVLGAAMATFWLNVLWGMGATVYWERDSGNLELYIMSPAPMMGILTGMALGGMTTTVVRAAVITITGVVAFDVPLAPTSWWLLAAVFFLTLTALYGLGMMFASLFLLWGREAWHLVSLLQEPIYLMSGTNFPLAPILKQLISVDVASIGYKFAALVVAALPLALGMDAMRQVLFRTPGLFEVEWEVVALVVMSVGFIASARWLLRYLENRARVEGKLSIRWQ